MDTSRYIGYPVGTVFVEHQIGMLHYPYCTRRMNTWGISDGTLYPDNPMANNPSYKLDSQLPGDDDYVTGVNVYVKKSPQEAIDDAFKTLKEAEGTRSKDGRDYARVIIGDILVTSTLPEAINKVQEAARYWFQQSVEVQTEIEDRKCGQERYKHYQYTYQEHFDFIFATTTAFVKATDVLNDLFGA